MAVEEPKYSVVDRREAFEVRLYDPVVVAETAVDGAFGPGGNEAFRRLAGYIFGGNDGGKKIAMTAPVAQEPRPGTRIAMTAPVGQERRDDGWVVSFTMPREWTLESLPVPDDPRVKLRAVGPRRVAAVSFTGTWGVARFDESAAGLVAALEAAGLTPSGPPVYARYDPPWTPWFLRRNEVLVPLTPQPETAAGAPRAKRPG
ncbi:heme-binding protein [Acidobacteria bacterium ACD]|nr:MAG: heme-binding protein [Acidobacteriota bacterium]MDL1950141.1 heme-binding protein [Acidobacteria bacterium ACD]